MMSFVQFMDDAELNGWRPQDVGRGYNIHILCCEYCETLRKS